MPSQPSESSSHLRSALRADQSLRWQRGEPVRVEYYLAQHPDLAADVPTFLELIYAEVLLRIDNGEAPTLPEYLDRFPAHTDALCQGWPRFRMVHPELHGETNNAGLTSSETPTLSLKSRGEPTLAIPGFELLEKLGEGGMGVVFKARQQDLDRIVALKLIRSGPLAGEQLLARFQIEERAVARLDHPGVVRIWSTGQQQGCVFFCMEYVSGGNLASRLRKEPLDAPAAAEMVRQLALAVQHAHEQRVLHRDLKPGNVLLDAEGRPKVSDFGLAKLLDADDGLTQPGALMGTPSYMAPEQADGQTHDIGPATDVYALGAILYECLTGEPPFRTASRSETLGLVKARPPAPPRKLRSEVPADLEAICLKCLNKQPNHRFATASELAANLQDWLDGKPAPPAGTKWQRLCLVASTVVVALAALVVGAFLLLGPSPSPPDPNPAPPPANDPEPVAGVWSPLLLREPIALHWPIDEKNSSRHYKSDARELDLNCEALGMLPLGKTTARRFQLSLTMKQQPWSGNIGMFFGYQDSHYGKNQTKACQVLHLVALPNAGPGKLFRVDWDSAHLIGARPSQFNVTDRRANSAHFRLSPAEHCLKLTVGPEGVESVSWDGKLLPEFNSAKIKRKTTPKLPDCQGPFGIYVCHGNGIFRDAQYRLQEE